MMPHFDSSPALQTDLYELTMAAAYFERRIEGRASFELSIRTLPRDRSYLVAAGIDEALDYLQGLHFTEDDIRFLREQPAFRGISAEFFEYLKSFRFRGEVHAVEEGTLVFAEEPILRVTAPLIEAQIVETYLLSVVQFDTMIASKAARMAGAAKGRAVLEFGSRRAHGPEAGVRAARAAYLGGCHATSNVQAGKRFGIPLAGTAAHSWTQVFPTERESFEALAGTFPRRAVLLIDTYDPLHAAEVVAALKTPVVGVRIDSGNLGEVARRVRDILDQGGARGVKIYASGNLNEYRIEELLRDGAPIDAFGVGTDLSTSSDAPALSAIYKLVEMEREGQVLYAAKFCPEKISWPGCKQVFRFSSSQRMEFDLIGLAGETHPEGEALLRRVMADGRRLAPAQPADVIRARVLSNLKRLPKTFHVLRDAPVYPVRKSTALQQLLEEVRSAHARHSA
jgi:nicotinate phosphoribosyltransferase